MTTSTTPVTPTTKTEDAVERLDRLTRELADLSYALYAVPVWELLVPADGEYIKMPDGRSLPPNVVGALFYGADGIPGEGFLDWADAATVANVSINDPRRDRRPARDLWNRRAEGYGKGLRDKRGGESS